MERDSEIERRKKRDRKARDSEKEERHMVRLKEWESVRALTEIVRKGRDMVR